MVETCLPPIEPPETIEGSMLWNEPNNKSLWDFQIDPDWNIFAAMIKCCRSPN
jgi:hypothetical protein